MTAENDRKFEFGDIVKHFKRETLSENDNPRYYLYKIIGDGFETETGEMVMVYQALYWPRYIYVRPYNMFMDEVDHEKYPEIKQKYRFEKVSKEEIEKIREGN